MDTYTSLNNSTAASGVTPALAGGIALASLKAVLEAGILAATGLYLGRTGVMTKSGARLLSAMSMRVTIPALLFSRVLPSVNMTLIVVVWPMLFLPAFFVALGALIGLAVVVITKPPKDFRRGTIAAVAFGNSTGMPLVLLSVIDKQVKYIFAAGHKIGTTPSALQFSDPIVYLSIYLLTYPIIQWVAGAALLKPLPPSVRNIADPLAATDSPHLSSDNRNASADNLAGMVEGETAVTTRRAQTLPKPDSCADTGKVLLVTADWPSRHQRVCEVWMLLRKRVLVPPVIGVLLGLVLSSMPPTYWLLCGGTFPQRLSSKQSCPESNAVLGWLFSGIAALGNAAVPINLILLGNSLSKGPSWADLPIRCNIGIAIAKLVVMPMVGISTVLLLDNTLGDGGLKLYALGDPWDKVFFLTAAAVTATPTANNMMVMTELAGGNRKAMSTAIFSQYLIAPVVLTISLTLIVLILEAAA